MENIICKELVEWTRICSNSRKVQMRNEQIVNVGKTDGLK